MKLITKLQKQLTEDKLCEYSKWEDPQRDSPFFKCLMVKEYPYLTSDEGCRESDWGGCPLNHGDS